MEQNDYSNPHQNRWPKIILASLVVLIFGAVAVVAIIRDRIVNPTQWQVSVIGQGKVSYQPDIANITLGAQIDKVAKPDDALNQLNDKMNKIIAAVKAAGVADEDIQTQNYSLSPVYDYIDNVSNLSGYNANQQLLVKVRGIDRDTGKTSKVIGEASKAGANVVAGISFDSANIEALKQEARLKAIGDAKSKAGNLAGAAGVRLGKVVGWWENIIQAPGTSVTYYDGKGGVGGGSATSASVPTGSQEVIIEVNLNYQVR